MRKSSVLVRGVGPSPAPPPPPAPGADTGAAGATKPPTGRHRRSENDCTARDGKPAARLAADEPTEAPDVHIRFAEVPAVLAWL
jgi:hypothetical protein